MQFLPETVTFKLQTDKMQEERFENLHDAEKCQEEDTQDKDVEFVDNDDAVNVSNKNNNDRSCIASRLRSRTTAQHTAAIMICQEPKSFAEAMHRDIQ